MRASRPSSWLSLPDVDEDNVVMERPAQLRRLLESEEHSAATAAAGAEGVAPRSHSSCTLPKRSGSWMSGEDVDEFNVMNHSVDHTTVTDKPTQIGRSSSWLSLPDVEETNVVPEQPPATSSSSSRAISGERPKPQAKGPASLTEALQTQHLSVGRLVSQLTQSGDHASLDVLSRWCQEAITITSSYSGMGTFEAVAVQMMGALHNALNVPTGRILVHSSTELMPMARGVLAAHEGPSRPVHIFKDILDRLPDDLRKMLEEKQAEVLSRYRYVRDQHRAGLVSDEEHQTAKSSMTNKYVTYLMEKLSCCTFQESAHCELHGCKCALSPRRAEAAVPRLWVEGAGVTCKAFSLAGAREGLLHESALPMFVWAFSMKYYQPSLVIHECVTGFPTEILHEILNESGPGPVCPLALHPGGATWDIAKVEFSPTDLGIPSRRKRQYTRSVMTAQSDAFTFRQVRFSFQDCLLLLTEFYATQFTKSLLKPSFLHQ